MKTLETLVLVSVLFFLGACSRQPGAGVASPGTNEVKRVTSIGVVNATPQPAEVNAGGTAQVIVHLKIQTGYHVNANPPTFPYLKATELDLPPGNGISTEFVYYPSPLTRTFAFADKPLAVYEGDTDIKATIKADKAASKGERSLAAQLRVQACDDQVCYPPGQIELRIPLTVK
jgi:hypothetical protein